MAKSQSVAGDELRASAVNETLQASSGVVSFLENLCEYP